MAQTQIVEFGAGKLAVCRTHEQGEDFESGIAFVENEEAVPIGDIVPGLKGKDTDQAGAFLRFIFSNSKSAQVLIIFSNSKSAQVLIEELSIVRDSLIKQESQKGVINVIDTQG